MALRVTIDFYGYGDQDAYDSIEAALLDYVALIGQNNECEWDYNFEETDEP